MKVLKKKDSILAILGVCQDWEVLYFCIVHPQILERQQDVLRFQKKTWSW